MRVRIEELRTNIRVFATALMLLGNVVQPGAQQGSARADLIQRSGFIFRGTIQHLASSNVAALPSSPNTIVVRVDEILKAPEVFESFRGGEVTVALRRGSRFKVGQQAVFYTSGLLYGESLAVTEVATVTTPVDRRRLLDQVAQSERRTGEQALAARLASAASVIAGMVTDVTALLPREESARGSEHDPDFWRATIAVETVLKGQRPATGQVAVFFAHSTDARWILSPKYTPGQGGIFLLHTEETSAIGQLGFTTLGRLDFQPASQLELVRRLLNTRR